MFERINKKVKGFFSSQRMKTLALMLLVGTTAAMAQNAAEIGRASCRERV